VIQVQIECKQHVPGPCQNTNEEGGVLQGFVLLVDVDASSVTLPCHILIEKSPHKQFRIPRQPLIGIFPIF
jgi:hypothetical protein